MNFILLLYVIFARPIAIAIEGPTYKHNLYAKCFLHVSCVLHIHKAFTLIEITQSYIIS